MKNITVYTTPTCVFCHALMEWFDETGVEYKEVDLTDPVELEKLEKKVGHSVRGVPVTLIGDIEIEGFNRPAIKKALKKLAK